MKPIDEAKKEVREVVDSVHIAILSSVAVALVVLAVLALL